MCQRCETCPEIIERDTEPVRTERSNLFCDDFVILPQIDRFRHFENHALLRDVAARQSRTTHAAPEAVDACVAYAEVLADAIAGSKRSEVLRNREEAFAGKITPIMAGSWRGKARDDMRASGYVSHSLQASLWSVARSGDYRGAVLLAANLGEDADTTGAIAGQLAGALYGEAGIPAA